MAIRSAKNEYPGVNPHLNSALQKGRGGWKGFHSLFLTRLFDAIVPQLAPDDYYVTSEESLQIAVYDRITDTPIAPPDLIFPDLTIRRTGQAGTTSSERASFAPLVVPLPETGSEQEQDVSSLVIYRVVNDAFPGTPVTRIELLSPANKPGGSDFGAYLEKREETLRAGLRLVEIDLLHERRPVWQALTSYPDQQENAQPYVIFVGDPRPTFDQGTATIYGFGVLDPLPIVAIPLDGTDVISVDFTPVYNETYERAPHYARHFVDYATPPERFDRYTPDDQQRIRDYMAQIAARMTPPRPEGEGAGG